MACHKKLRIKDRLSLLLSQRGLSFFTISTNTYNCIYIFTFSRKSFIIRLPPTRITWLFACKFFRITDLLGAGPFPFGDMGLLCFGSDRAAYGSCRKRKRTGNQAFPVHRGAPGTAGLRARKKPDLSPIWERYLRFGEITGEKMVYRQSRRQAACGQPVAFFCF